MSRSTYSLGLIGYPLQQSLSPRLHGAALAKMGLQGEYRLYPIPPLPDGETRLSETIDSVRKGQIQGLNVTIPHKQAVLPYLDQLTPQAQAIGAVNTIFCREGVLTGDNTDAPGFITHLRGVLAEIDQSAGTADSGSQSRTALVMGAGGAARAVVYALWQAGWKVTVAARHAGQAKTLVASLLQSVATSGPAATSLAVIPLEASSIADFIARRANRKSQSIAPQPAVLVNASSAGMLPDNASCAWPEGLPFPENWLVYDLVYKPPETTLLRRARAAGLPAVNGLGMLVEQAALALERWTGLIAPRQAMWEAVGQYQERGIP
jgi:shikimate dehydrogenase